MRSQGGFACSQQHPPPRIGSVAVAAKPANLPPTTITSASIVTFYLSEPMPCVSIRISPACQAKTAS
jgi:hypothetical protein